MILFKKNNLFIAVLLVAQTMQSCIIDDMREAVAHIWNKVTPRDVVNSCSQAVTQSESWLRAHSTQAAILVACTALVTLWIVNTNSKRNVHTHSGEFFTGFEQGQLVAKNDADIYLTLQQEAYRQGWHDALNYIERMQDQPEVQETDPDLIELQKAFKELANFFTNNELEIELIFEA